MEITTEETYKDSWNGHDHGDPEKAHVHAVGADWSLAMSLRVGMESEDSIDVVQLMEFRALVMGMASRMENMRENTELEGQAVNDQQFAILAYNADVMFTKALVAVIDKAMMDVGINPPCQLQSVESSNIRSFGYVLVMADESDEIPKTGILYVAFTNGGLYRYENVPSDVVEGFIEAESKGAYFGGVIRPASYLFTKVAG